jgi:hypothetical protein
LRILTLSASVAESDTATARYTINGKEDKIPVACPSISDIASFESNVAKRLKDVLASQMNSFSKERTVAPPGITEGIRSDGVPVAWYRSVDNSWLRMCAAASLRGPVVFRSNVLNISVLRNFTVDSAEPGARAKRAWSTDCVTSITARSHISSACSLGICGGLVVSTAADDEVEEADEEEEEEEEEDEDPVVRICIAAVAFSIIPVTDAKI